MDVADLRRAIERIVASGDLPLLVVARPGR